METVHVIGTLIGFVATLVRFIRRRRCHGSESQRQPVGTGGYDLFLVVLFGVLFALSVLLASDFLTHS